MDSKCDISKFISALYYILNDINYCFIRGSFIFEDNDEYIFNLLTYGTIFKGLECPNLTRDRGTVCLTSHDIFLSNIKFKSKKKDSEYILNNDYTKEKLLYTYKLSPYLKSISMYEKKINNYVLSCNGISKIIKVMLYYPFKFRDINKKFLFVKLETSRCLSLSHITDYTKSKKKINSNIHSRREKDKYTNEMYLNDLKIYREILERFIKNKDIKHNIIDSIEDYDKNVRVGSEFFIPADLINIILTIYFNYNKINNYKLGNNKLNNNKFSSNIINNISKNDI